MRANVLVVDDDSMHLKLYSRILERGGFKALTALVGSNDVNLPTSEDVDLIALDYRLNSKLTAVDVARTLRLAFPGAPIVVLSEMLWMPDDMVALADAFVSKGNPEKLLQVIGDLAARGKKRA